MTSHRDLYPQLVDEQNHLEIARAEGRLNAVPRYYIIEGEVAAAAAQIEDGDILAMATTVGGLDVAHTGIALWKDGGLHLMNAPWWGRACRSARRDFPTACWESGHRTGSWLLDRWSRSP